MLPIVIKEQQIFTFQFWFDGSLRYGMYYRSDLYCMLKTFDINQRTQAYQVGCKLTNHGTPTVLTLTESACNLWGSLRDPIVKEILLNPGTVISTPQAQALSINHTSTESKPGI